MGRGTLRKRRAGKKALLYKGKYIYLLQFLLRYTLLKTNKTPIYLLTFHVPNIRIDY